MSADVIPSLLEELIDKLDPNVDYGERSYEQVCDQIRNGTLTIKPIVYDRPIIRDPALNGRLVRGSGRLHSATLSAEKIETISRFLTRAAEDFDSVYEALTEAAVTKGDVRAQKVFMEMFIGRPKESTVTVNSKVMDRLLDAAEKEKETVIEVIQPSGTMGTDKRR
tara:strand:- start:803 stop:1300 length:498 start_codon:yes stop_codon:yes gene_type:complete